MYLFNFIMHYLIDKDSIKSCQNSDQDYFEHLVTGKSFTFNKYVDERDAVNNRYI